MKSAQYLAQLYSEYKSLEGAIAARETVSAIVFNLIVDLEEEGREVSPEAIQEKLAHKVKTIIDGPREEVA